MKNSLLKIRKTKITTWLGETEGLVVEAIRIKAPFKPLAWKGERPDVEVKFDITWNRGKGPSERRGFKVTLPDTGRVYNIYKLQIWGPNPDDALIVLEDKQGRHYYPEQE